MHCYFNSSNSLDVCIINIIKLEKSKYFPSVSKLSSKTTLNIENENASSSLSLLSLCYGIESWTNIYKCSNRNKNPAVHSSQIGALCLMKLPTLQNLSCLWNWKPMLFLNLCILFFPSSMLTKNTTTKYVFESFH